MNSVFERDNKEDEINSKTLVTGGNCKVEE